MDEHQRRMWGQMIEKVDSYLAGGIDLRKLVSDLQGLLGAADIHDEALIAEFWNHFVPIDSELELRTEAWAPAGAASEDDLRKALADYRAWAQRVLDTSGDERR